MAQAGADQHQRQITVGGGANASGPSPDIPVQAFNDVVGADIHPVPGRESQQVSGMPQALSKHCVGIEVKKAYLRTILYLYDRRIVSNVIRDTSDNPLVFVKFRAAIATNPEAHPLGHCDRGLQYTQTCISPYAD